MRDYLTLWNKKIKKAYSKIMSKIGGGNMRNNEIEYNRFVWEFNNIIKMNNKINEIVFVCIGTTKIIGDSFGPIVGTYLKENLDKNEKIQVIGDIKEALTYDKIEKNIKQIEGKNRNKLIIVLDSALSNSEDIGKIFIQNRGLKYGESLKKNNSTIGNISIKAVVGEDKKNNIKNFNNLRNVSIEQINNMTNIVSKGIINVMNKRRK